MVRLFQGRSREPHEALFWEHIGNKAVREGDWKLVGRDDPKNLKNWELYNLANDRSELKNVASEYSGRVRRMANAWIQWAKETGL
jgi:arylsulfatase A-like enzyme